MQTSNESFQEKVQPIVLTSVQMERCPRCKHTVFTVHVVTLHSTTVICCQCGFVEQVPITNETVE